MPEFNGNHSSKPSILERVQGTSAASSEAFEPRFSNKLEHTSDRLSTAIEKTSTTYKSEDTKFGGKPFPWD